MTPRTEGDQVFSSIITQSSPRLNVMHLKTLDAPARLATPAVSLEDLTAELAISLRIKPQPRSLRAKSGQSVA
jgi:hypothetical protein